MVQEESTVELKDLGYENVFNLVTNMSSLEAQDLYQYALVSGFFLPSSLSTISFLSAFYFVDRMSSFVVHAATYKLFLWERRKKLETVCFHSIKTHMSIGVQWPCHNFC